MIGNNRLAILGADVEAAHSAFVGFQKSAAEKALEIGRALNEAKPLVPHGKWGAWLSAHNIPARTASRCMALAREGFESAIVAVFGFGKCEEFIKAGAELKPRENMAVFYHLKTHDPACEIDFCFVIWNQENDVEGLTCLDAENGGFYGPPEPIRPWVLAKTAHVLKDHQLEIGAYPVPYSEISKIVQESRSW